MIIDYRFIPLFPMAQGTLPWQPILGSKLAKSDDYSRLFVAMAFPNGLQYRHYDFRKCICDDLATLLVNLVNFGSVTPEFKNGKYVLSCSYCRESSQILSYHSHLKLSSLTQDH